MSLGLDAVRPNFYQYHSSLVCEKIQSSKCVLEVMYVRSLFRRKGIDVAKLGAPQSKSFPCSYRTQTLHVNT